MFKVKCGPHSLGVATFPETWLDADVLQRALRRVYQTPAAWLNYGEPAGDAALRRHAVRVTTRLQTARQRTVRLVHDRGCRFMAEPADLFGWVDMGADAEPLAQWLRSLRTSAHT